MIRANRMLAVALFALSLAAPFVRAAFDEQFMVREVVGDCQIATGTDFQPAVEGQPYPYGSTLKTGRKSSLVIVLSDGNECRVLANTVMTLNEATLNKKVKSVRLDEGKIEVSLLSDYAADGSDFSVETPAAVCGVIGSKLKAEAATEGDLHIGIFGCVEGKLRVLGPQFELPLLDADDVVSIAATTDKSFIRIKNVAGTFPIVVKDSNGASKTFEMKNDCVVKIWQRLSATGDFMHVTLLIIGPDEALIEAINYTDKLPDSGTLPPRIGEELKEREPGGRDEDIPDDFLFTTTTTTTSTTTTTRPSPTPVGKR